MPAYDSAAFRPPAPVALVDLCSAQLGRTVSAVPMLLDSGADATCVPQNAVSELIESDQELPEYELEAFDGRKSTAPAVTLELLFLGKSFRGQFLVVETSYGVLGRNVLNHIKLTLDGPNLDWTAGNEPTIA